MTRRVLILGASSGIAQEASRCFAAEHAKIFLVARDPQKLRAVADDLRIRGAEAVETQQAELTNYSVYSQVINRAFTVWAGLEVALVAHGTLPDQSSAETDPAVLGRAIETNYVSVIMLLAQLATVFQKQGFGILSVIGSVAGDRGRRSNYVYGSAKAGVATFVAGLRLRLAVAGVTVVLIKPGWVNTPMTAHLKKNFLFASAEQVGRGVYDAIISRKPRAVVYLPWYWNWIMTIIRVVPEPIFAKLNM
jgi:decaprenylphospho-beta-D-erythro-pentofuranosid-2-ulose 2-reductase